MLPLHEIPIGNLVKYQVNGTWCIVVDQLNKGTVILHPNGTVVTVTGGYGEVKKSEVQSVYNTNSKLTHLVINNKIVCGSRFSQTSIMDGRPVTCKKCLSL